MRHLLIALTASAALAQPTEQLTITEAKVATCAIPNAIMATHKQIPYPTQSQRAGEVGSTRLSVTVGADGTPTDVTVARTSGSSRLDDAAIKFIKSNWLWAPLAETCAGSPVQLPVTIVWHLGSPPKADAAFLVPPDHYPPGAVEQREGGYTFLKLSLDDKGSILESSIIYSSGYADLDDQALAIVRVSPNLRAKKSGDTQILALRWELPSAQSKGEERVNIFAQRIQ